MKVWEAGAATRRAVSRRGGDTLGRDGRRLAAAGALALIIDALALASLAAFVSGARRAATSNDEAVWISVQLETDLPGGTEHGELRGTELAFERSLAHDAAANDDIPLPDRIAVDTSITAVVDTASEFGSGTELDAATAPRIGGTGAGTELGQGTTLHLSGNASLPGTPEGTELGGSMPRATREDILVMLDDAIRRKLSYPPRARERGIEGRVLLEIGVDESGELRDCSVEASSGSQMLDSAASLLVAAIFPLPVRLAEPFIAFVAIEYRLR